MDTVLSDTSVFSPLTVTPSPDMLALKLQQVAEKTALGSGESRLLRRARAQRERRSRGKAAGDDAVKVRHKSSPPSQIPGEILRGA